MHDLSQAQFRIMDSSFREHGPVDWTTLLEWARRGKLQPTTWVWNSHESTWRLAGEMQELTTVMPPAPSLRGAGQEKFIQPVFAPPRPELGRIRWQSGPTSGLAIAAFLCGIAGLWLGPLALAAIGLGHIAQWRFRHSPPVVGGFSLALYGVWLGYLSVALLLFQFIRSAALRG
jgi:hypothetical protein